MRAGRLRHRIQLQHATETQDTTGDPVRRYTTYATVWASIQPVRGAEYFTAQQAGASRQHEVRIRYRDDVEETDRIVYGSRTFEVEAVLTPWEVHSELLLYCKEIA